MKSNFTLALSVLIGVVAATIAIYFTPLHHLNLVPPAMNEMDPKVFYDAWQKHPNDYILIDVRSPNIYTAAHAKGAINIPVENLYDDHVSLPRSGKKIALICTTGRLAAIGYGYLEDQGFTNLIHIEGGMVNWGTEGLPVEGKNISGAVALPDEHQ